MSKQVKTESVDATVIASDCEEEDDPKRLGSIQMKGLVGKTSSGNSSSSSSKVAVRCCQAEKCSTDLAVAKPYHRRHKVCEVHAKAQVVLVAGIRQRFCQQCSRFHEVAEFDESKRSCRRRLAGHNERRRKSPASATATTDSPHQGQGITSSRKTGNVCGRVDDSGRFYSFLPDKHFHIR